MKYSKIKSKKSRLRIILLIIFVALFVASGAIAFLRYKNKSSNNNQQATSDQQQTEDIKFNDGSTSTINNGRDTDQNLKSTNASSTNTTQDSSSSNNSSVSISIDSLSQSSGQINLVATVSGVSSGDCAIKFTAEDGTTFDRSVAISPGKCSLSLSELEFSYIGKWSVTVSAGGTSASQDITIQ